MTKRILLIFCLLATLILPATAATKGHNSKHSVARSRKTKSKSIRKSTHRRARTSASRKRAARARRQRLARK